MEQQILTYLKRNHTGRANAVSSRWLEAHFHIPGTRVRECINALRRAGHPICSDDSGYYYAKDALELDATIRQLSSRIGKMAGAKRGLDRAKSLFPGGDDQTKLPM